MLPALLLPLVLVSAAFAAEFRAINPPLHVLSRERDVSSALDTPVIDLPSTNAERLARGLPLMKAKFGRTVPGRKDKVPSPVES
jgi:hypothetical protein